MATPVAQAAGSPGAASATQERLLMSFGFDRFTPVGIPQKVKSTNPCPFDARQLCTSELTVTVRPRQSMSTTTSATVSPDVVCCGGGGGCTPGTYGYSFEAFMQQNDGFGNPIYNFGHYQDGQYNCSSAMVQAVDPFDQSQEFLYSIGNTGSFGQPTLNTWSNCWCYHSSDGGTWPTHAHSQFTVTEGGIGTWGTHCETYADQFGNGRVECYDGGPLR